MTSNPVGNRQRNVQTETGEKMMKARTIHLNEIRMNMAKQLLVGEKLFVGEVSDRIGYKHPHHFSAAFKRKFGILPGDLLK